MSNRQAAGRGSLFPWRRRNKATGKLEQVGWVAMVDHGRDEKGKRKREAMYAPMDRKKDLAAQLNAAQDAKDRGNAPMRGRLTVEQWLNDWLRAKEAGAKTMRPRTLEHYRLVVDKHIVPAIGPKQLAKLTPTDVERMLGAQLKAGLSPRTVHHIRAVLRNALQRALRDAKVSRNVAGLAEAPSVPEPNRDAVTAFSEQVASFLAAVESDRLAGMYVLTLAVGLRLGEVTGLRWSDIDLDTGILRVTKALQWLRPAGEHVAQPHLVEPKTNESRREIELAEPVVEALRQHRARWVDEQLHGQQPLNEFDLVFTGPAGEPLNPATVSRELRAILERAQLPRIRFHDLRHANASLMLTAHVPMEMLSKLLGHSNPTTTRNIYAHVLRPLREEAKRAQADIFAVRR
jgi:integrase